jgi:hypothetical protein
MARPGKVFQFNRLGLPEADLRWAQSWMPEIAIALSPDVRHRVDGTEVRIGRKGALRVNPGFWWSHEADEGGSDPATLVQFLRPDWDRAQVRDYLLGTCRQAHPGTGGDITNAEPDAERMARWADFARASIKGMQLLAGTPAELYGVQRGGIFGNPNGILGWLPDDARVGEGALAAIGQDKDGEAAFLQVGYLDALGRKVEIRGTERRQFWINPDVVNAGFYVRPAEFDPGEPLYLCEGLENACSLALARPAARIIGLPGIGRLKGFSTFKGQRIVVFRDGDGDDSPARRTLLKHLDGLLLQGAVVQVTDTPKGEDPNSLLQSGGVDAINVVLATAVPVKLSPQGMITRAANLKTVDYETERKDLAKAAGIRVSSLDAFVHAERDRRHADVDDSTTPDMHAEPVTDIATVLDVDGKNAGCPAVRYPRSAYSGLSGPHRMTWH